MRRPVWLTRSSAAVLWLSTFAFAGCVALAAIRTQVPLPLKFAFAAVGVTALTSPAASLLLLAALLPIAGLWGAQLGTGTWSEALVLAAWAGWALSAAWRRERVPAAVRQATLAAIAFGCAAAASGVVQLAGVRLRLESGMFDQALWRFLTDEYFQDRVTFAPLLHAAAAVEGVVLFSAASTVLSAAHASRAFLRMFVLGSTATAATTTLELAASALGSPDPLAHFAGFFRTLRFSAVHSDLNAAGSFYALSLLVTAGLACGALQERRRAWTAVFAVAGALQSAALWWTGSRTALLALVIVASTWVAWKVAPRRRWLRVAAALLLLLALAGATALIFRYSQNQINSSSTLHVRAELARTALRLTATAPAFGVGIGRFYERSHAHIASNWVKLYYSRENSHNNYLQVLAELGIVGAVLFLWWIASALLVARHVRGSWEAQGLLGGVAAFLLTCLGGHPLLVREISYAFWIALGAAVALGAARAPAGLPLRSRLGVNATAAVALLLVVASVPSRWTLEEREANLEHVAHGATEWRASDEGVRYRSFTDRALFFVPTAASSVRWQMRTIAAEPVTVRLALNGKPSDVVTLSGRGWREVRMVVPSAPSRFVGLEMRATTTSGAPAEVQVGRIEWVAPRPE